MPRAKEKLIARRREEIIDACEYLYQFMDYRDINLKEISKVTSFSRPTIYNYFQSKEEIFLALLAREYERWNVELDSIVNDNKGLTEEELADKLARSLEHRTQMLKLLSTGALVVQGSSQEEIRSFFKSSFIHSFEMMDRILEKFCPWMPYPRDEHFILTFFSLMSGINSYAEAAESQKAVIEDMGMDFMYQNVYSLTYNCILGLLKASDINIDLTSKGVTMIKTKVNRLYDFREIPVDNFVDEMPESEFKAEMDNEIKKDLLSARVFTEAEVAEAGDVAELKLVSNRPRYNREKIKINLGLGLFSKELESGVIGHRVGEDFTIVVEGNIVNVSLISLKRKVSAKLDDDFAMSLGIPGVSNREEYLANIRDKYISLFSDAYVEFHAMDIFDEMISRSDIDYDENDIKLFLKFSGEDELPEEDSVEMEDAKFILDLFLTDCVNRGINYKDEPISLDSQALNDLRDRVLAPIKEHISDKCKFVITEDE